MLRFKSWFLQEDQQQQTPINGGQNPTKNNQDLTKMVQQFTMDPKINDLVTDNGASTPGAVQAKVIKSVQDSFRSKPPVTSGGATTVTPIDVANGVMRQINPNVPQIGAKPGSMNR